MILYHIISYYVMLCHVSYDNGKSSRASLALSASLESPASSPEEELGASGTSTSAASTGSPVTIVNVMMIINNVII